MPPGRRKSKSSANPDFILEQLLELNARVGRLEGKINMLVAINTMLVTAVITIIIQLFL